MAVSRKQAQERGQAILERPRGDMHVTLFHGRTGVTLRYQRKVIAKVPASQVGALVAPFVARALGVKLPETGSSAEAVVTSGILYRVLSIASLDLRAEEGRLLLAYLLDEADTMRGYKSAEAD